MKYNYSNFCAFYSMNISVINSAYLLPLPVQSHLFRTLHLAGWAISCTSFNQRVILLLFVSAWMDGPRISSWGALKWEVWCLQLWCNIMGACHHATALEWTEPCAGLLLPCCTPHPIFLPDLNIKKHDVFDVLFVSFQVVGAVAFQNRRLTVPQNTSPMLASLMEACWNE